MDITLQEVRDIDEAAFREGRVRSKHFGELLVPRLGGFLQQVKQGGQCRLAGAGGQVQQGQLIAGFAVVCICVQAGLQGVTRRKVGGLTGKAELRLERAQRLLRRRQRLF